MNIPQAVAANTSGVTSRTTESASVVGLYTAKTSRHGIHSTATSSACLPLRYTARENSARSPAGVAEIEAAPNTAQISATPRGQRRRHHNARQATEPQPTSTINCEVDNGPALSLRVGIKKNAPSAAARKHPAPSKTFSRAAPGPNAFGSSGSTGASSDCGGSCAAGNSRGP